MIAKKSVRQIQYMIVEKISGANLVYDSKKNTCEANLLYDCKIPQ
jgi:hypothetical protein